MGPTMGGGSEDGEKRSMQEITMSQENQPEVKGEECRRGR